jgi:hypothetical protein
VIEGVVHELQERAEVAGAVVIIRDHRLVTLAWKARGT